MSSFDKKWAHSGAERMDFGRVRVPLRHHLEDSRKKIQTQIERLSSITTEVVSREQRLYLKLVRLVVDEKKQEAGILANEIAELRRVIRITGQAKLALEQISIRIGTITELGDVAVTLAPATVTIKDVQESLKPVVPGAEGLFNEIADNLRAILQESNQPGEVAMTFDLKSEEVGRILEEAALVAGNKTEEALPTVPSGVAEEGKAEAELT